MNYNKETNGKTKGKIVSRNQITDYFVKLAETLGELRTITLPADVCEQERELHETLTSANIPLVMNCMEVEAKVFDKVSKTFKLDNMRYENYSFADAIHMLQQQRVKHNAIWFDACGYYKSFIKEFIEACEHNLDSKGLAFFTAKVTTREIGINKKYLYDYYKFKGQETPDDITIADLVGIYRQYLQSRLPKCKVFYELTYTTKNGHSFVVFGVSKGIKMRKFSKVIHENEKKAPKKKKITQWDKVNMPLAIAMHEIGVMYKDIAEFFGVEQACFSKKMLSMGFRSFRKPLSETITINEAMKVSSIKALLPKPKNKEENMNSKIANQVLRLSQQGQTSEEIAQEIGQSKMQVAGIKASISRGTYGETKKQSLAKTKIREQVLTMLDKGKTDEQILAKVGISNSALGSYKARRTMRG